MSSSGISIHTFQDTIPFERRRDMVQKVRVRYPDMVPVFLEKHTDRVSIELAELEKRKFLVPWNSTMGHFIMTIRKRFQLNPTEAIFVFIVKGNESIAVPLTATMSDLYYHHQEADGFLYMKYAKESVFG